MTCPDLQDRGGFWEDQLARRCTFPIGPVNTWTNLAYIVAAIAVSSHGPTGRMFAFLLALLGFGSGAYHGWKTLFTDRLDNAGMYLVFGGLLVYAIAPTAEATPWVMLGVGAVLAWRFAFVPVPDDVENVLMGAFVGAAAVAVALWGHPWAALGSLGLMALSYGLWWLDRDKSSLLARAGLSHWGHGLWHCGTAAATYWLFVSR